MGRSDTRLDSLKRGSAETVSGDQTVHRHNPKQCCTAMGSATSAVNQFSAGDKPLAEPRAPRLRGSRTFAKTLTGLVEPELTWPPDLLGPLNMGPTRTKACLGHFLLGGTAQAQGFLQASAKLR